MLAMQATGLNDSLEANDPGSVNYNYQLIVNGNTAK